MSTNEANDKWEEYDTVEGHTYFYNPITGESKWKEVWESARTEEGYLYYYCASTGESKWAGEEEREDPHTDLSIKNDSSIPEIIASYATNKNSTNVEPSEELHSHTQSNGIESFVTVEEEETNKDIDHKTDHIINYSDVIEVDIPPLVEQPSSVMSSGPTKVPHLSPLTRGDDVRGQEEGQAGERATGLISSRSAKGMKTVMVTSSSYQKDRGGPSLSSNPLFVSPSSKTRHTASASHSTTSYTTPTPSLMSTQTDLQRLQYSDMANTPIRESPYSEAASRTQRALFPDTDGPSSTPFPSHLQEAIGSSRSTSSKQGKRRHLEVWGKFFENALLRSSGGGQVESPPSLSDRRETKVVVSATSSRRESPRGNSSGKTLSSSAAPDGTWIRRLAGKEYRGLLQLSVPDEEEEEEDGSGSEDEDEEYAQELGRLRGETLLQACLRADAVAAESLLVAGAGEF